jgi:hypothetical protein
MELDVLLHGKIGMSRRVVCFGVLLAARVIKKILKSVNPSKAAVLKPVIRIGVPIIKDGQRKIGEIVSDGLPILFPSLLSVVADLKNHPESVNEYAKEFKEEVPDLILLLSDLIKQIIESNEKLSEALGEIRIPFAGNVELKDMGITLSVKLKEGGLRLGYVEDLNADASLALSTKKLFEIVEELKHGAMDAMEKALAEEMRFYNSEALSKVHQSVVLLDVIEDLLGVPIG